MATSRKQQTGGTRKPTLRTVAGQEQTTKDKPPPLTEVQKRQRYTATAANLLASQGPSVIICWLPRAGTNILLRRVDLLSLVAAGELPAPLSERVAGMIRAGGVADEQLTYERLAETVQAMRSIAVSCAIAPPAEFLEDEDVSSQDIDGASCLPLFVMPGEPAGEGQVDVSILAVEDLKEVTRVAVLYGPAALSLFRRE